MKIGGWAPHELHEHEAEEVARDQAEGVRLAYVAATRARDLLVVPALGDEPWDGGWFGPLESRALSAARRAAQPGARAEVSGVQIEGHACWSGRTTRPAAPSTVAPGRARASPRAATRSSGGIPVPAAARPRREDACSASGATT